MKLKGSTIRKINIPFYRKMVKFLVKTFKINTESVTVLIVVMKNSKRLRLGHLLPARVSSIS